MCNLREIRTEIALLIASCSRGGTRWQPVRQISWLHVPSCTPRLPIFNQRQLKRPAFVTGSFANTMASWIFGRFETRVRKFQTYISNEVYSKIEWGITVPRACHSFRVLTDVSQRIENIERNLIVCYCIIINNNVTVKCYAL